MYYTNEFMNMLEEESTKIAKKVYNVFDHDIISIIIKDNIFWLECRGNVPIYARKYIISKMNKLGYRYLYS